MWDGRNDNTESTTSGVRWRDLIIANQHPYGEHVVSRYQARFADSVTFRSDQFL
jgi:hypothetical protein